MLAPQQETALHLAASIGYLDLVRQLVAHGATVAQRTCDGQRAEDLAAALGHDDVVELLAEAAPCHQAWREAGTPDTRELAYSLLEVQWSALPPEKVDEIRTVLQMTIERIDATRGPPPE